MKEVQVHFRNCKNLIAAVELRMSSSTPTNVLIPDDFAIRTRKSIEKIFQAADQFSCG